MELISVLMPTYNVAKFIDEAVGSILAQTYTNFELIVVDDCSTDGTYERLLELAETDSRIRVFRNEQNSKICKTLNRALIYARGNFIARMDGDDISLPNRLECLKNYLDGHPSCDLVGSAVICIGENGEKLSQRRAMMTWTYIEKYMKYNPCLQHIWMARRRIYDCLAGYREIPYAEDYDFLLRGMRNGFQYANVEDYVYKVRMRNGNTASTNGLYQQKARKLVQRLYKEEKKAKRDLFTEDRYESETACTRKENEKFSKANQHLTNALHSRGNKLKMVWEACLAMLGSWYLLDSLFASMMLRLGNRLEIRSFSGLNNKKEGI